MIIYKSKFEKFVFEDGKICKYIKNIFGRGWLLLSVVREGLTLNQAKEIKKQVAARMAK